ncbi:hypothetical protein GN156_05590 [bacterium LRH843]|nr:hypothetical protein [bacterium LRH843]
MENYELVQAIRELINNLQIRLEEICKLYQNLNYEFANAKLSFFTEDFMALLEGVLIVKEDYQELDIEEIQEKLQEVLDELENGDYQLLADLLFFELKPLLQYWEEQIIDG